MTTPKSKVNQGKYTRQNKGFLVVKFPEMTAQRSPIVAQKGLQNDKQLQANTGDN